MCGLWFYRSGEKIGSQNILKIKECFYKIQGRWPDSSVFNIVDDETVIGFHRLAIMDPSEKWDQPFIIDKGFWKKVYVICNGEIYNYEKIIEKYNLDVKSGSDCEVIPLLYEMYWIEKIMSELLWEFVFVIYDQELEKVFVARDPIWVRPLFLWRQNSDKFEFGFCSQLKWLAGLYDKIIQFYPGQYLTVDLIAESFEWKKYYKYDHKILYKDSKIVEKNIRDIFSRTVKRRLMSDRPLGCLLSGGLDSSICSAIAAKYSSTQIKTFTIGLEWSTDIPFAEKVADFIWSDHTTFLVTQQDALDYLDETIRTIESFDITTVRASVWQLMLAKKIKRESDVKVLLCGELSDELMSGYKYFHNTPDLESMHRENIRLVKDIYRYDGLRADRTMSENGLEVRLPFADIEFVDYILSVDPKLRIPKDWIEKYLFRKAFDSENILPSEVLWRSKEAFSDGISKKQRSWFEVIQDYIDTIISDEEFLSEKWKFIHCPPQTKEAYYYRKKFVEYFWEQYSSVIPYFWMPKWCGNVDDPSARILDVYK